MDKIYAFLTSIFSPFISAWIFWRALAGKEDKGRLRERFGFASRPRPKGKLLWLHAASVGESVSVLPLITRIGAQFPHISILLTTGTRTSAALMQKRLPKSVIHQYVPVDTPEATWRFMRHWRPEFAFFVESEFWPDLVAAADSWQCFTAVINGRMSARSFAGWQRYPALMTKMLSCFDMVFARSGEDAERFRILGAKEVHCVGDLKYDADPLPCDEAVLATFKTAIGTRPVWLAASTHPGEEKKIEEAHALLAATRPNLLTIIVPRHPERGADILSGIDKRFGAGLRSRQDAITPKTGIYIADTLGELGLFYRLSEIVFMGGSLVKHGGQNPLEPARLSCTVLTGPHTHNFFETYYRLELVRGCLRVKNTQDLAAQVATLLSQPAKAQALQAAAKNWLAEESGATGRLLAQLAPAFEVGA